MSGPVVRCEVDTCTHWLPNNVCGAANIDILYEEEGQLAEMSEHTECKTFYHKSGLTSYLGSMDNVDWAGMAKEPFMDGQQINPSVTCTVESCEYWKDGDLCDAEEIKVSGTGANECQDTNCKTFKEASDQDD